MAYQPNPKQSLFLWNLICSSSAEGVVQTQARPPLTPAERAELLDEGFLNLEERGAKKYLTLTDRAWTWAEKTSTLTVLSSPVAAEVLQSLLRRLIPFLEKRRIGLAELLPLAASAPQATGNQAVEKGTQSKKTVKKAAPVKKAATKPSPARAASPRKPRRTLDERIEDECLSLADGKRKTRVMLSALRRRLKGVARGKVDQSLLALQEARRLVLYREDNSAALSEDDRLAALLINNEPRHLVMLEGAR